MFGLARISGEAMKTKLPGTPIGPKEWQRGKFFTIRDEPKLRYRYDAGEAIGRYLAELKQGRLIARRCDGCRRVMIPPRMFCERCFRPTDDWVFLRDTGTILTFSLCYVNWRVRRLKRPEIPAVIEIDGASPGMGILHRVKKVAPEKVHVGMRVRAVWKPSAERTGAITDIAHWEPATPEERR